VSDRSTDPTGIKFTFSNSPAKLEANLNMILPMLKTSPFLNIHIIRNHYKSLEIYFVTHCNFAKKNLGGGGLKDYENNIERLGIQEL
jgi:hypothetical protein